MRRSLVHSRSVRMDGSRPRGKRPQRRMPVMSLGGVRRTDALGCVSKPLRRIQSARGYAIWTNENEEMPVFCPSIISIIARSFHTIANCARNASSPMRPE